MMQRAPVEQAGLQEARDDLVERGVGGRAHEHVRAGAPRPAHAHGRRGAQQPERVPRLRGRVPGAHLVPAREGYKEF